MSQNQYWSLGRDILSGPRESAVKIATAQDPQIATFISTAMKEASKNNVVTCVYCGHEYPEGTPTAKAEALTDHIKACEKHPMREAERKTQLLRKAIIGLVGVETPEDLDKIEAVLRITPAPEQDKIAMLNAVHALRETL